MLNVGTRSIRKWIMDYEVHNIVKVSNRGKHSKDASPIFDETFRAAFILYVKENSKKQG